MPTANAAVAAVSLRTFALRIGEENGVSYLLAHQTLRTRRVTVATKVSTSAI